MDILQTLDKSVIIITPQQLTLKVLNVNNIFIYVLFVTTFIFIFCIKNYYTHGYAIQFREVTAAFLYLRCRGSYRGERGEQS